MENISLYNIDYYKKTVFKGSYKGMNFHIEKDGEDDSLLLKATCWKGPFILEKTKEEINENVFPFSQEGLSQAEEWLEQMQKNIS